jgi:hypothetical protein
LLRGAGYGVVTDNFTVMIFSIKNNSGYQLTGFFSGFEVLSG